MKILIHVNQAERWEIALNNVKNIIAMDNTAIVELALNGEAPALVTNVKLAQNKQTEIIERFIQSDVIITVCQHSLDSLAIHADQLATGVKIVAAGAYEIALRQQQGFGYLKP
ncbi:DsrE family protein [Photobacterium toruni]|uniref:DsrE family protein n=1 Tax=Photobacterium toruni TaxID=1935446 RepID=A0ABU6L468_9GAMM|nr:DsrE family protein [Photobacterium toruni]MEC6813741.1 DsrE family protein [Photobacterium toruni]MEC6830424.1 DsrE family protein [Photobacterium toruni]